MHREFAAAPRAGNRRPAGLAVSADVARFHRGTLGTAGGKKFPRPTDAPCDAPALAPRKARGASDAEAERWQGRLRSRVDVSITWWRREAWRVFDQPLGRVHRCSVLDAGTGTEMPAGPVGAHPCEMVLGPRTPPLGVRGQSQLGQRRSIPRPAGDGDAHCVALSQPRRPGRLPNSVALAPDEQDALSSPTRTTTTRIFDVSSRSAQSLGFIPSVVSHECACDARRQIARRRQRQGRDLAREPARFRFLATRVRAILQNTSPRSCRAPCR